MAPKYRALVEVHVKRKTCVSILCYIVQHTSHTHWRGTEHGPRTWHESD